MKYIEQIRGQNHGASQLYQRWKNKTIIDVGFVIRTLNIPNYGKTIVLVIETG